VFDVYLYDVHIGTLTPRGRGVRYSYTPQALENGRLPSLSVSLPKRVEPFPDSLAGPFFRNLLPEQAFRRLIAAAVGTAAENSLSLLGAIGGECPGAVSIWPQESRPPARPEYEPLDRERVLALFSQTNRQPLVTALTRGRLSLAGAQEKIALLRDRKGKWLLPMNGAITSHILKHAPADFPHVLENELYCMALAAGGGLNVALTGIAAPDIRVFCTERFDRPSSPGDRGPRHRKIHQEDFCQILSVEPDRKYEADGGPGLKKCAAVLRRYSSLPADDLLRLIRWVGFNYLIGNEDAHAKNLALLYGAEGLRLTPHYDLVSTTVYRDLKRSLAMKLGRAWDIRNVQRTDWQRVADAIGLPWTETRVTLLDLVARIHAALQPTATASVERFGPSPIYEEIARRVTQQVAGLEREIGSR
jgi:serine/threonine-protein kinase HipA